MESKKNPNARIEKWFYHIKVRSFLRARVTLMKSIPQKVVFVDGLYIVEFHLVFHISL
jgi:hypothetical protein